MSHKEGAQGTLAQERGTLLRRDVLAAAHAAEDLEVQGFALLLGSERETEKEGNVPARTRNESTGPQSPEHKLRCSSSRKPSLILPRPHTEKFWKEATSFLALIRSAKGARPRGFILALGKAPSTMGHEQIDEQFCCIFFTWVLREGLEGRGQVQLQALSWCLPAHLEIPGPQNPVANCTLPVGC